MVAGVSVEKLNEHTNHDTIVRCMPNIAVSVGEGMTSYFSSADVSTEQISSVEQLLRAGGRQ
jgi:pyrroline-5-carboxylate reductase